MTNTTEWLNFGSIDNYKNDTISAGTLPSGLPLAIYRVDDEFFVTADRCTHGGASFVEEGELIGHTVECAWHNGTFDIRDGAAKTLPCRTPLMSYETKIEAGELLVSAKPRRRERAPA